MTDQPTTKRTSSTGTAVLLATAFLLAALVIIQAGKLPANQAHAGTSVASEGFSLLTVDSGRGDDLDPQELLFVIDSRDEMLLVYEIEDARKNVITLRDGGSLHNLFLNASR